MFISNEYTKQGKWYLGVASMDKNSNIKNMKNCQENKLKFSWKFPVSKYHLKIYIGGAYCFMESKDEWSGSGIIVSLAGFPIEIETQIS